MALHLSAYMLFALPEHFPVCTFPVLNINISIFW